QIFSTSFTYTKSRNCWPSLKPSLCDLNNFTLPDWFICLNECQITLAIRPLWYSLGPYTLKNFNPAQNGGCVVCSSAHLSNSFFETPYGFNGFRAYTTAWSSLYPSSPEP